MKVRIVRVTRTLYYEGPEENVNKALHSPGAAVPATGTTDFGLVKITSAVTGIPVFIREEEVKVK